MEPTPETQETLRELTRFGDTDVATVLRRMSRDVLRVVPECVGLSLATIEDGLTFTMTSSEPGIAELDAFQYLDGGPCVAAAETGEVTSYETADPIDEHGWHLFAMATAAAGVASTLSLPISRDGRVTASVNLYASTSDAFDGHHDELAALCGAWAPGAVTNADLSFRTREEAAATPGRIRDQNVIDQAVGMLAASTGMDLDSAAERLRSAAERARISESQVARAVIGVLSSEG